ncbi:MAG: hypothetical protein HEQ32_07445 [Vampirovibrio sp.]
MSEYIRQSIPPGRSPYPGYRTAPAGGYIPLEKQSELGAFAMGSAIGATSILSLDIASDLLYAKLSKRDTDLTQTAKEHLRGKGLWADTKALFKRPDLSQPLKQTGDFAQNAGTLIQKGGTHSGGFLKAFWNTWGGKWTIIPAAIGALWVGASAAGHAHARNEKLAAFEARNPHRQRPPSS